MLIVNIILIIYSLIVSICFLFLCFNVFKIKKTFTTDFNNYLFYKAIGDNDKAYFFLQRDLFFEFSSSDLSDVEYYNLFKELGCGIPDIKNMQHLKNKEENLNKNN